MFNSSKNSDLKDSAEQVLHHTKARMSEVADDAKAAAAKVGKRANIATKKTREEALVFLDTLREMIDPKESTSKIEQFAETVIDSLFDWKDTAENELTHAYRKGKIESRRFVQKRTLLAVSLAIGAGALIAYLASDSDEE
jgi:ABC-type transporter MlaC component